MEELEKFEWYGLRFGNWYNQKDGGLAEVITPNNLDNFLAGAYEPITITDEWLRRIGFLERRMKFSMFRGLVIEPLYEEDHTKGWLVAIVEYNSAIISFNETKWLYVHQIQDIIYNLKPQ